MSVIVFGFQQRTTSLDLLERLTLDPDQSAKVSHELLGCDDIHGVVALSTCHRTEIYVEADRFHESHQAVRNALCRVCDVPASEVSDTLVWYFEDEAVDHLFSVAAGLDSAVLGEHEILGQVRTALARALSGESAGADLDLLFRHAIETGKRVRTETAIARGTASVSHAAVELAGDALGGLSGRHVLVIGAGEMGEGVVTALRGGGVTDVTVANRTAERARDLARRFDGAAIDLGGLTEALTTADLVVSSTGASDPVVTTTLMETVLPDRSGRPLVLVDIALPRDIEPSVAELPAVTLLNLADLEKFASRGLESRSTELAAVEQIVDEEIQRFRAARSARVAAPVISSLRARAEAIRVAELERQANRLSDLTESQHRAVEALTRGLVAKLLHQPSVQLKSAAIDARADQLAASLSELFDL